jgi:hypothetical protein
MNASENFSADRMCEFFRDYIAREFGDKLKIMRIMPWLNLIAHGIDMRKTRWWAVGERQLHFEVADGKRYKAKFDHDLGFRGGIVIIEIATTPGEPEIETVESIRSDAEAKEFFLRTARKIVQAA